MKIAASLLAALLLRGPAFAADAPKVDIHPIARTSTTVTGQPIVVPQNPNVVVSIATFPPGARLPEHQHPGPHYVYVLEGVLTVVNTETNKTFEVKQGDFRCRDGRHLALRHQQRRRACKAPGHRPAPARHGQQHETAAVIVVGVASDGAHRFSKPGCASIRLIEGLGVEGDAHLGVTVQHLSRLRRDPTTRNLRQVHLIHAELHDELNAKGFRVGPGDMGENITTRGIDLLGLSVNARLHIGATAIVEVKGLRNPCAQLDGFQNGLLKACLDKDADGNLIRKAGIMGVAIAGGEIRPGDAIRVVMPAGPFERLVAI